MTLPRPPMSLSYADLPVSHGSHEDRGGRPADWERGSAWIVRRCEMHEHSEHLGSFRAKLAIRGMLCIAKTAEEFRMMHEVTLFRYLVWGSSGKPRCIRCITDHWVACVPARDCNYLTESTFCCSAEHTITVCLNLTVNIF